MTKQTKQQDLITDQTIAIDKDKIPEIAPSTLMKIRPKRELSDKQKENLAKLIEKNKERALQRRGITKVEESEIGNIPDNKLLVKVKAKRAYTTGKQKHERLQGVDEEEESELKETTSSFDKKQQAMMEKMMKDMQVMWESKMQEADQSRNTKAKKPLKSKKKAYDSSSTSDNSDFYGTTDDSESESDVLRKKTKDRMKRLEKIDSKIANYASHVPSVPQNKYAHLSIF